MTHESTSLEQKKLPEQYFMKMKEAQADARLGKLKAGQVVSMDEDTAARFLGVGLAEQVSSSEYKQQQERREQKLSARRNAFAALNEGHAVWDVSTYRDVLTAPEKGLRLAHERGIPLVNVHMLRDDEGDPLAPDADIEDILEARSNMHPDLLFPFTGHDRSSVMGGGPMYQPNVQVRELERGENGEPTRPALRRAQRRAEAGNTPQLQSPGNPPSGEQIGN